jgi:hypothetical protein
MTLLLLCIATVAAFTYVSISGVATGQLTGRLILCWQILLCAAIGGDFRKVNLLPSVLILGAIAITSTAVIYVVSAHRVTDPTGIEFSGWLDAIPLAILNWLLGLGCRWASKRSVRARAR